MLNHFPGCLGLIDSSVVQVAAAAAVVTAAAAAAAPGKPKKVELHARSQKCQQLATKVPQTALVPHTAIESCQCRPGWFAGLAVVWGARMQRHPARKFVDRVGAAPKWHTAAIVDASQLSPEGMLRSNRVVAWSVALHWVQLPC